ncbi:hypothetical protein [Halopiger djelfimassiliensis]|uniref:hypothetical protein n=1 Tax=Halopiger djelfimassiliensis TaxID=1293047 RepID=UPI0006782E62|nr:hypothetical protein [Halopiger djelfimassiliensis]
MAAETRRKTAARCTECDRTFAVWVTPTDDLVPIGSVDGCPCGASALSPLVPSDDRPDPSATTSVR